MTVSGPNPGFKVAHFDIDIGDISNDLEDH